MSSPGVVARPLGGRIAVGAAWMVSLRIAFRLIGFGTTLVLVRLLAPEDFGIVAMASVAYGLLDRLGEFSFDLALIQMKAPERRHYDTAWTFLVLRGLAITGMMVASAPFVADVMNEPRVQLVIYVLALSPLIEGFENIRLVDWRREFRFDRIFWLQLVGRLIGICIAIPAAFILHNYWAVILGPLVARAVLVPLGYWLQPYRPGLSISARWDLFHFSKWLIVSNLLTLINVYMMTILVGRLSGPAALGHYQVAREIGELPASEVAAPIRQPLYSGYAKLVDDIGALRTQALDGLAIVLLLVVPLSAGLAVTADLLTPLLLGPRWLAAAPLIAICALSGLFESIGHFVFQLYLIRNAQARFALILAATVALRIALVIPFGIRYGVVGAALAMLATSILNCTAWVGALLPLLHIDWRDIVRVSWRVTVSAILMATVVQLLHQ